MGELTMPALARRREPAVQVAPARLHLPLALGHVPALLARLDPPRVVIVGWVVGPTLPVEFPLQSPQRLGLRGYFRTEGLEQRCLLRHHRDGGGAQIEADNAGAEFVLRLAIWHSFTHQLGIKAVPQPQLAADQADILDRAGEAMGQDW